MKKLSRKQVGTGLIALVITGLILVVGLALLNTKDSKQEQASVDPSYSTCDDDSFYQMIVFEQMYLTDRVEDFIPVAENVEKAQGHESSPNCMFIMTMYALNTGKKDKVSDYFSQLEQAYDSNDGYVGTWKDTTHLQKPEDLKPNIDSILSSQNSNSAATEWVD